MISIISPTVYAELVIVSDTDTNGNFLLESNRPSYYVIPSDIAVNDKYLYVLDSNNGNIQIFEKPGMIQELSDEKDSTESSTSSNNGKEDPILYFENDSGIPYILENPAKFKKVGAINEEEIGLFYFPTAITVIEDWIYVLDGSSIYVFDELANKIPLQIDISTYNSSDSQDIVDIHGENGLLYLVGDWTTPIHVLDRYGEFVESIPLEDSFTKFSATTSINEQFIYAEINTYFEIYDHSGKLIDTIDTSNFGSEQIEAGWISDIVSSDTHIYTIHQTDGQLRIFDINGNFETSFDFTPYSSGLPFVGEMVIDDKYIYISNSGPNRNAIHVLDFMGNLVQQISNYGLPSEIIEADPPEDRQVIVATQKPIIPDDPVLEPNTPLSVPESEVFETPVVIKIPEKPLTSTEQLMEPVNQVIPDSQLPFILPLVILPPSILSILLIKYRMRQSQKETSRC